MAEPQSSRSRGARGARRTSHARRSTAPSAPFLRVFVTREGPPLSPAPRPPTCRRRRSRGDGVWRFTSLHRRGPAPRPPKNRGVLHGYDRPPRGPARQTSGSSTSTPSLRAVRRPEHQATRRTRTAPRRLTHNRTTAARAGTVATMTTLRQLAPAASRRRRLVPSTLSRRTIIPSSSSRRHARDRPERPTSSASRTTADHN